MKILAGKVNFQKSTILFPRAIIQILEKVEIVTYAFAWLLGRGQPKFFFWSNRLM